MSRRNSLIGSPVARIEDLRFVRGAGEYVDDVTRPGLLHAVILRSQVAHGRLVGADAAAARTMPGMHAVITAAEIGASVPTIPLRQEPLPEFRPYEQPVIATGKVRYVGEPIAVVVAESKRAGEDALERVEIEIEHLPAVTDRPSAARGGRRGAADLIVLVGYYVTLCYVYNVSQFALPAGAVPFQP